MLNAHHLDDSNSFPCPCIGRNELDDTGIRFFDSGIQTTFTLDSTSGHHFHEVPFPVFGKALCKLASGFILSRVKLKSFLEAFGGSNRVRRIGDLSIVETQRGKCWRERRVFLE
jgi:hypothetical protein